MNTPRDPARVERERIIAGRSSNGVGWKRDVLAEWGVPWPPPPGWKTALIRHGFPYQPDKNARAMKRQR